MVKLTLLEAGYCTEPEHIMIRGGRSQRIEIPALVALIEHPKQGLILYDTGYSFRFFEETRRFPYSLFAKITPVTLQESDLLTNKLAELGIQPGDIGTIIVSHFHPDHIGALKDFPNANFIYFQHGYEAVKDKSGIGALVKGYFPAFLPDDFEQRGQPITQSMRCELTSEYEPFEIGYDLLGDESLIAVDLPGHAVGQMGIFAKTDAGTYFLIADATWLSRSYRDNLLPHPIASFSFANWADTKQTQAKIHKLYKQRPDIHIIPSHCPEVKEKYLDE